MKRILLLAFVLITAASNLSAQSFGIGARIGPSFSTLITDDEDAQEAFTFVSGGQVDVYLYKMFNKWIGIEGGLMLTQNGYGFEFDSDLINIDNETKNTYFAIPVSARFKFGNFTLNPGIRYSSLISTKQEGDEFTDDITSNDFGVFVSPGVQFPIGITLNGTLYLGLTDVVEPLDVANTNFSFQLSVGYTFLRKGE